MKKERDNVILMSYSGSIKYMRLEEFMKLTDRKKYQYILFPNIDDANYIICMNSKIMDMLHGYIRYNMSIYSYTDESVAEDDPREFKDEQREQIIEVENCYDFYSALYSILKLRYAIYLLHDTFVNSDEDINGFSIDDLYAEVTLSDNSVIKYEWKYIDKISIFSNYDKLCKGISIAFNVPWKDFRSTEDVFRIKNDDWDLIHYTKIKKDDLIGFISQDTLAVQFISIDMNYAYFFDSQIDIEIYGAEIDEIKKEYPDIKKYKHDGAYLNRIDIGNFMRVVMCYMISLSVGRSPIEKAQIISNMIYLCKYIEALSSEYCGMHTIDEMICLIRMTYDKYTKYDCKRGEVILSKYNTNIFR